MTAAHPPHRRKHLRRLPRLWKEAPLYFVTACTLGRKPVLLDGEFPQALADAFRNVGGLRGWSIGRYVLMPDHVHFFCAPRGPEALLSDFMRDWKKWTADRAREAGLGTRLWQAEFFDHVLRSPESYRQKWEYVRFNPVRKGLCAAPEEWPHQGEIESLRVF